jgi:hypothetical protein
MLYSFFKRIAYKKGRAAAITATVRKLAIIIWNMVVKKQKYSPIEESLYAELIKKKTYWDTKSDAKIWNHNYRVISYLEIS